jgi:hypothetical protein
MQDMLARSGQDNPPQTLTLVGVGSARTNEVLVRFMAALLNVKACHTLMTAPEYRDSAEFMKTSSEPQRNEVRAASATFDAPELEVSVFYPSDSSNGAEYFNERQELSGEVDLNLRQTVCYRQGASVVPQPVTLGELVLAGVKENAYRAMFSNNDDQFISLNRYLLSNKLQGPDNDENDPRYLARNIYRYTVSSPSDGLGRVLEVGAPN